MVYNQTPDISGMWVMVVVFFFSFFHVLGWKSGAEEAASEVAEWHKSLVWVQELLVQVQCVRHCLHATPVQL